MSENRTIVSRLAFEQQERESAKAFAAFALYLGMGPERSLDAVSRKLGKSKVLMERWSRKYDWPARVQAHASHMAVVEREAQEALVRMKSAEWIKRQDELKQEEWDMHGKCIAAGRRALDAFLEKEKVYANLADIARILEVASKLGRLASGLATEKSEVTGEDGGPIRIEFEAALKKIYGAEVQPPIAEPAVVDVETVNQPKLIENKS